MATPFNLPALGENVDAGTVVGILVAVGDQVEENQPVLEIETDKANLEVPSGFSGVVTEILVENGATAEVGAPVLMYEEGAGEGAADGEDTAAGEAAAAVVETTTPAAGEAAAAAVETTTPEAGEAAAAEAHEQAEAEAPAEETREPTPESSQTPPAPPATTASPEPSTPPAADAGSPEKTAAPSPPAPVVPAATSTSGAPVPRGAFRTPLRPGDRPRHRPGTGNRSRRPHIRRRRQIIFQAVERRPRARSQAIRSGIAAGLREMGPGGNRAHEQPAPCRRGTPVRRVDEHPSRHLRRQGRRHPTWKPYASSSVPRPKPPAES